MEPEPLPSPDPAPDPPPDRSPSLAQRLGEAARRGGSDTPRRGLPAGVVLALVLWAGSSLVAGATSHFATTQIARLSIKAVEPDPVRAERRTLATLGTGSFAGQVDRIARLLPPEARLQSIEVDRDDGQSRILADIATPDPDRLRSALSREGGERSLRVVNERRGDGVIIVSVQGAP